jgi:hypothetical protein
MHGQRLIRRPAAIDSESGGVLQKFGRPRIRGENVNDGELIFRRSRLPDGQHHDQGHSDKHE